MSDLYGYGIVDKEGKPWFDENGKFLHPPNYNPPAPYRVVTLYWVDNNAAQAEEGYPQ